MKIILNILIAGLLLVQTAYTTEAIVMATVKEMNILLTIVDSREPEEIQALLKQNPGIASKRLAHNQTALMFASLKNRLVAVKALVEYHNNGGKIGLNAQSIDGTTALMMACYKKENAPIVSALLEAENINAAIVATDVKITALMIASTHDNLPAVQALLQYYKKKEGNDIALNAQVPNGMTALMMACHEPKQKPNEPQQAPIVVELLQARNIDAAAIIPNSKETALIVACTNKNLAAVQALVQYHNQNGEIGINERNSQDITALMMVCYEQKQALLVSALLQAKNINAAMVATNDKMTALIIACLHNNLPAVQALLGYHNNGGDIALNTQGMHEMTALMWACYEKYKVQIVLELLAAQDIDAAIMTSDTKLTALIVACRNNNFPAVKALAGYHRNTGKGIALNAQSKDGETALIIACENDKDIKILHELLTIPGIDATIRLRDITNTQYTALQFACSKNNLAAVQALLQYHANDPKHDIALNAQNPNGWSALMTACGPKTNVKIAGVLLSTNGINATLILHSNQRTALMLACEHNPAAIPAFIKYHNKNGDIALNVRDIVGWTALMMICDKNIRKQKDHNFKTYVEQLLSLQDINANITITKEQFTAFTIACYHHNSEILSAFLEYDTAHPGKVNLNAQLALSGKTGLMLAVSSNQALAQFVTSKNPYIDYNLRDNDENNAFMIAATIPKISNTNLKWLFNKTSQEELDICNVFGENAWNILYQYYDVKNYHELSELVKNLIATNVITQENIETNCLNEQTKQQLILQTQQAKAKQAKAKNVTPTKDVEKSPVQKRQKITINDLAKIYQEKPNGYLQNIQKGLNRLIIDAKINQPIPIDFQVPTLMSSLNKTWKTTFQGKTSFIPDMHHIVNISVQVTPEADGTLAINWQGGHADSTIQAAINAGLIRLTHKIDMGNGCFQWNLQDVITQKTFIKTTFPEQYDIQKIYNAIKSSMIKNLASQPQGEYNKITNNLTQINAISTDKFYITIMVDNDPESTLLQAITAYPKII